MDSTSETTDDLNSEAAVKVYKAFGEAAALAWQQIRGAFIYFVDLINSNPQWRRDLRKMKQKANGPAKGSARIYRRKPHRSRRR